MARKPGKSSKFGPPFVMYQYAILNSHAYKDIPHAAGKALPLLMAKVKKHIKDPERYTTVFSLSYKEAKKHGFARSTYAKIIRDLVTYGFIDPVAKGGLTGAGKTPNLFKLSRRWESYGTEKFIHVDWISFIN